MAVSACALSLLILSACGSHGNNTSAGTGGTIQLTQIVPIDSSIVSFPQYKNGAQLAVTAINAEGGVKGKKIELTDCDDKNDPNLSAQCAQDAARSKSVATVSSLTLASALVDPVLEAAKMPMFGLSPTATIDTQSKYTFPLTPGQFYYGAEGPLMAKALRAKTAVVLVSSVAGSDYRTAVLKYGAKEAGIKVAKTILIPPNTTDMSSIVQQIAAAHPDVVLAGASTADQIEIWKAMNSQRVDIPIVNNESGFTNSVIAAAGAVANDDYFIDFTPDASSNDPSAQQYRSDVQKYGAGMPVTGDGFRAWASVKLLAHIMGSTQGSITRDSLYKTLNAVDNLNYLFFTDLNFAKPGPIAAAPRVFVTKVYLAKTAGGKIVGTDLTDNVTSAPAS